MTNSPKTRSPLFSATKRSFLAGAAAGTFASVLPTWRKAEAADKYDLIVIGAGTAGMPAVIFAAERGAKILVVEKAPVLGGTLDRSTGQISGSRTVFQKAAGIEDSPDAHYADNMRINHDTADPVLTRLFVDNAGDTINWLAANGFTVRDGHPVMGGGHEDFTVRRYQWGPEGGKTIFKVMEPLFQKAVGKGKVTVLMNTGAIDLIQDKSGAVTGVVTQNDEGVRQDHMGRNVLLTAGGCAANPRMFRDLNGVDLTCEIAYPYSQGQGILLGEGAGGYVRGGDKYATLFGTVLTDYNFPSPQYGGLQLRPERRPPWEIYVNVHGRRFVQEDHPSVDFREHALLKQPGQRMWVIADQTMMDKAPDLMFRKSKDEVMAEFNAHPMFHKAETLDELAVKAGFNPAGLSDTAAAFNRAIDEGAPDPMGRQHRPVKLANGPYYAIGLVGWTVIGFAGLAVDGMLRVIRSNGTPVPNLYAAGEVIGAAATSGGAYTNGAMVTPALTFGRLLGQKMLKFKA
ncbi:MAG: FAD-binding protein [Rhodobacteraceae bacterium]|nr:FAD-binding protein [Paracoccaceae bacterium]